MTLKATEVGKTVVYSTSFDMSSKTTVELKITYPDGSVVTIPDSRITVPAVPLSTSIGNLAASTYMQFTTLATDFTDSNPNNAVDYTICGTYNDATPKTFYGDDATISVEAPC